MYFNLIETNVHVYWHKKSPSIAGHKCLLWVDIYGSKKDDPMYWIGCLKTPQPIASIYDFTYVAYKDLEKEE